MKQHVRRPEREGVYEIRTAGWNTYVPGERDPGSEVSQDDLDKLARWIPRSIRKLGMNSELVSVKFYRLESEVKR